MNKPTITLCKLYIGFSRALHYEIIDLNSRLLEQYIKY